MFLDASEDHAFRKSEIRSAPSSIQKCSAFSKLNASTGAYTISIRNNENGNNCQFFIVQQETAIAMILRPFVKMLEEVQRNSDVNQWKSTESGERKKAAAISVPSFSSSVYRQAVIRVNKSIIH